jgi:hypothetical protein
MILNLVPDVATFRTALRTIRLWARSGSAFEGWKHTNEGRSRDIRECFRVSWWCSMGTSYSSDMSIIPHSSTFYDSRQILPNILSVVCENC